MIVFDLRCVAEHRFEGWFASGADFDTQRGEGLLSCPVCGSDVVSKLPSAKISLSESPADAITAVAKPAPRSLTALMHEVLANTEDVGQAFPEEARRIHYDEAPRRSIRGVASRADAEALIDEGIAVLPLPIPPRSDLH